MTRSPAIVDAHHHVWDPDVNYHPWLRDRPVTGFRYGDYSRINRRYLVPDYLADARDWRVAGSVYVEAEWDPTDPIGEMDFIAGLRRASGYPSVAVRQIRLDERVAAPTLERLASYDFVRSVRQKPRANAAPRDGTAGGMTDASWREGFAGLRKRGLRFDLQTPWWHLHEAAGLARDFPDTPIIINHAGLPADRSAAGLSAWRDAMARVADCANIAVKISGIGTPGLAWTADRNREIVLTVIDLFGVERCMFGSNFPVDSLLRVSTTSMTGLTRSRRTFQPMTGAGCFTTMRCRFMRFRRNGCTRGHRAKCAEHDPESGSRFSEKIMLK